MVFVVGLYLPWSFSSQREERWLTHAHGLVHPSSSLMSLHLLWNHSYHSVSYCHKLWFSFFPIRHIYVYLENIFAIVEGCCNICFGSTENFFLGSSEKNSLDQLKENSIWSTDFFLSHINWIFSSESTEKPENLSKQCPLPTAQLEPINIFVV